MIKYLFLLFALLPLAANADGSIGRLFTTPGERSSLDYLRQTSRAKALEIDSGDAKDDAPATPSDIAVQGYVKRGDGQKSTVWINSVPMQENSANADVQVGKLSPNGNLVPIVVPGSGRVVGLKAGQVYVPDTDKVEEINAHAKAAAKAKQEEGEIDEDEDALPVIKKTKKNKVTEVTP